MISLVVEACVLGLEGGGKGQDECFLTTLRGVRDGDEEEGYEE